MSISTEYKRKLRQRRAHRVRARIHGTAQKPRFSVFRSLKHISAQIIDDDKGVTLVSANDYEVKDKANQKPMMVATEVGKILVEKALKAKIKPVVFDRGAYRYHGRIKALADSAREGGLDF